MTLVKLLGLALLMAVLLLVLRETGGRLVALAATAGGILLLSFLVERYRTLFAYLTELPYAEPIAEATSLALRVLGISFLTEITAGICRDLGEGGLATKLEWCGRAEILVVSLPMLSRLLSLAVGYLGG